MARKPIQRRPISFALVERTQAGRVLVDHAGGEGQEDLLAVLRRLAVDERELGGGRQGPGGDPDERLDQPVLVMRRSVVAA